MAAIVFRSDESRIVQIKEPSVPLNLQPPDVSLLVTLYIGIIVEPAGIVTPYDQDIGFILRPG